MLGIPHWSWQAHIILKVKLITVQLYERLIVSQLVKKFPVVIEPNGSALH
jgi:hypothetical protein